MLLRILRWVTDGPFKGLVAPQFGNPRGWLGRLVAQAMNKANLGLSRWVLGFLEIKPGQRVLECGFGGGVSLPLLIAAAGKAEGVDQSPDMLAMASRLHAAETAAGRLELKLGALPALPYGDAAFDRILSVNTVYFFADPASALRELRRVLKPGGRLALGLRAKEVTEKFGFHKHGFKTYSEEELAGLMKQAGFSSPRIERSDLNGVASLAVIGEK